ncbi:Neural-cadherin [Eumeta japonica]|uniref:Neural-cadherin n=1 Tax=Eumeta variegata TaxID=151549 RepID=A0A4C2A1E0_EUMVA|nr:Neural-cadherin [Eumeta japonica]
MPSPADNSLELAAAGIASRIRYEITSGNIGGAFAVKNMTGAIYVAGALDYETRKRVPFLTVTTTTLTE